MVKKLIKWGAISFAGLLFLIAGLVWYVSRSGHGRIEEWLQGEVITIANGYLNPKLSFDDLQYQAPYGVSLKHMKLTGTDPITQKPVDIISCDSAEVTLAEIPKIGKPIVIEKISLQKPTIQAIAVGPESPDYIGFSHLMADPAKRAATPEPAGRTKLSDSFAMRLVELVNAKMVYDPRIAGTVPMELDGINTTLKIAPSQAGTYALDTLITKDPVFSVKVTGDLDLDNFSAKNLQLALSADLGADKLDYLPPQLQKLMKQYDARGKLTVNVTGDMPVMEPTKGKVNASIRMTKANVSTGDLHLPVETMSIDTAYADGGVTFKQIKLDMLGGTVDITGSALLNDRLDATLSIDVAGVQPERIVTHATQANAGDNPGTLDCKVKIAGALYSIMGEAPKPKDIPLASIHVDDFHFSANDPANPGQKLDIAACKLVDVILGEPVVAGKPIVIEKIVLDDPVLSAVAADPHGARFVGVPPKLSASLMMATSPPQPAAGPMPSTKQTYSDLYRIGSFQLNNAKVVYDPRIPGTRRMWLGGINTSLTSTAENPGIYSLAVKLGRPGEFDFDLASKIDLDHLAVHDFLMTMNADLTGTALDFLPPELQAALHEADANGKMNLKMTADVPFNNLAAGVAQADMTIDQIKLTNADGSAMPVQNVNFSANLAHGVLVVPSLSLAAAGTTFNGSGSIALTGKMPADFKLSLKNIPLEPTCAAIYPTCSGLKSHTLLSADVELQASMLAAAGYAPTDGAPLATVNVSNIKLAADRLTGVAGSAGDRVDFVSVDHLQLIVAALPTAASPIEIGQVLIDKPAIQAIATAPNAKTFVGISSLIDLFNAIPPAPEPKRTSQYGMLDHLAINGVSLTYDPKIAGQAPMSLSNMSVSATRLSEADRLAAMVVPLPLDPITFIQHPATGGDVYAFTAHVPAEPTLKADVTGRITADDFRVAGLSINSMVDLAHCGDVAMPPQMRAICQPLLPMGMVTLAVTGDVPLLDPTAGDVQANVQVDRLKFTTNNYRLGIDQIRVPVRVTRNHAYILPAATIGGPMVQAFNGTVNVVGDVTLNDRLDSDLQIGADNLDLDAVMKTYLGPGAPPDLKGYLAARVDLHHAPLLVAMAHAMPYSPGVAPSPLRLVPLPPQWGTVHIEIEHARLAGLEIIQKLGAAARSAFATVMNLASKNDQVVIIPKEKASLVFDLHGDRGDFSTLYYEGEIVVVTGMKDQCHFDLQQNVDMKLQGGPIGKLGGFGEKVANFSNSLYTFVVSGTAQKPDVSVTTGDGKPIIDATKNIANKGEDIAGKGINAAGSGIKKGWGWIHGDR